MSADPRGRGGRRSISEQVADAIRVYTQAEGLRPGDRLGREEDLARQFGVSRPTLREALRPLASSHLVRASKGPGGGIFVAATPEEGIGRTVSASVASMLETETISIDELLETRMLFEVPLVGLAAQRATDEEVAQLKAIVAEPTPAPTTRSSSRRSTSDCTASSRRSPATGSPPRSRPGSSRSCSRRCGPSSRLPSSSP
jgi:DNA-binding FadR family transcriptional regulator